MRFYSLPSSIWFELLIQKPNAVTSHFQYWAISGLCFSAEQNMKFVQNIPVSIFSCMVTSFILLWESQSVRWLGSVYEHSCCPRHKARSCHCMCCSFERSFPPPQFWCPQLEKAENKQGRIHWKTAWEKKPGNPSPRGNLQSTVCWVQA